MPGIREVLAFSGWDGTEVLEHFILDFCQWELIEDPCNKLQGIFDCKEVYHFRIRSLTLQLAARLVLAVAVHEIGVINSRVESRVRYEIELSFAPSRA